MFTVLQITVYTDKNLQILLIFIFFTDKGLFIYKSETHAYVWSERMCFECWCTLATNTHGLQLLSFRCYALRLHASSFNVD